uniref:Uncharacterized protein n=1 Tax=Arundo donax TaxID=35708 RepID=A0A0A9G917_ARUDO
MGHVRYCRVCADSMHRSLLLLRRQVSGWSIYNFATCGAYLRCTRRSCAY